MAKEAGISYGLVYFYFNNKEDLSEVIFKYWWNGLFQLLLNLGYFYQKANAQKESIALSILRIFVDEARFKI